jgi:hypothetical protein
MHVHPSKLVVTLTFSPGSSVVTASTTAVANGGPAGPSRPSSPSTPLAPAGMPKLPYADGG